MSIAVLRQMFEQMVEKKDSAAIDRFYDPSFVMSSNGITQDFDAFAASHRTIYATPICYSVEYDEQAWIETTDRVAGRVWITTSRPGESPTRIEVVLIAAFNDSRITAIWGLRGRAGAPCPHSRPTAEQRCIPSLSPPLVLVSGRWRPCCLRRGVRRRRG